MDSETEDLENSSRTLACFSTNITSGVAGNDERRVGQLHERFTPQRLNYVSADTQEVVRRILDHESPQMTAHYANPRELHQTGEFPQVAS